MALARERCPDFGPTFAREKPVEMHGRRSSVETLRQWMVADGLWKPKLRRAVRVRPSRPRRACFGDPVRIDGSPRDWFEGCAPACALIAFIDGATSRLPALGFPAAGTTEACMRTMRPHPAAHGRPVACHSGRYGVFRVDAEGRGDESTPFTRALKTLDIEPIHAGSPQAKGRVERADRTLRDRLVKEMRLRGAAVTVRKAFDGTATVLREGRELPVRRLAVGEAAVPVEDGKPVVRRVEKAKAEQRSRPACKPAPDHPWRSGCDVRAASRMAAG